MALDWNWSLNSNKGTNTATQQSASTSGMDILNTLIGNPPAQTASTFSTNSAETTPGTTNPAGTVVTPNVDPSQVGRWQGGAPNPNGTQDPNTGRQTGGRYVDPNYQYDATGRALRPDEQSAWRAYDTARANASTREQAGYQAYRKAVYGDGSDTANGTKTVFDARTKTWSVWDATAKKWEDGITQADLLGKLSDDTKNQYPDWWWGQTADSAIAGRANDLNGMAGQYAQQQAGGRQQTRYSTYGF